MADGLVSQIPDLAEFNRTLLIDKIIRSNICPVLYEFLLFNEIVIEGVDLSVLQLATLGL